MHHNPTNPDDEVNPQTNQGHTDPDAEFGRPRPAALSSIDSRTPAYVSGDALGQTAYLSVPPDLIAHPRYRLLEVVGSGGMGTVFKARHGMMDRFVALKVMNQHLVNRPRMVEMFQREVRAAARLAHPNIVHAYDADQAGATHFLVMEYVLGMDLKRMTHERGALPAALAVDYVRQAALGLQHAHLLGMIHCDIKPHNLMVTPKGQVKILDFGLAQFVSHQMQEDVVTSETPPTNSASADVSLSTHLSPSRAEYHSTCGAGTLDYMAPEECLSPRRADIRADIYSLGCTLYHLLTGRVPFPGDNVTAKIRAHRDAQPLPIEGICPGLTAVIEQLMAKDPSDRPTTPAEAARALRPYARLSRAKLLLVEDDGDTRAAMRRVLEVNNFSVADAADGAQALVYLRRNPLPDLILLDLLMPGMNGLQFLHELKQDMVLASVPVIIVSALDSHSAQAAALGAADCVSKPVNVNHLTDVLLSHMPG